MRCIAMVYFVACSVAAAAQQPVITYGDDLNFINKYAPGAIELKTKDQQTRVLVSGAYQGRVLTSTATGKKGSSFGWLNYALLAGGEKKQQFNPIGGEERFWLGPEGGQFSIYFKGGDSFVMANWQVPGIIDTAQFSVEKITDTSVVFTKKASCTNYSGTNFDFTIQRQIQLLNKEKLGVALKLNLPEGLNFVAYETVNRLTNTGAHNWEKSTGLLSIWLLGMFSPSPETVVIIPFKPIDNAGRYITSDYFGAIPAPRLVVKDSLLLFTCDGRYRSKIGLAPAIAKPVAAAFDAKNRVLTVVVPNIQANAAYVNSQWKLQDNPFKGDVINAYNDGALADGTQMGPFFEIESSSPALALKVGETGVYKQVTCHISGNYRALKKLAFQLLHINLDDFKN
jgi:hypothetical protein